MRSIWSALLLPFLSLSACSQTETGQAPEIPLKFQGRWGLNAEQCARSSDVSGDWSFVDASSLGGFEHMYELTEVSLTGNDLYFITSGGGPAGRMKLLNESTLQMEYVGESAIELTLCSKDVDF
jgi:hypothetical protein